jgi:hypothetical protein
MTQNLGLGAIVSVFCLLAPSEFRSAQPCVNTGLRTVRACETGQNVTDCVDAWPCDAVNCNSDCTPRASSNIIFQSGAAYDVLVSDCGAGTPPGSTYQLRVCWGTLFIGCYCQGAVVATLPCNSRTYNIGINCP